MCILFVCSFLRNFMRCVVCCSRFWVCVKIFRKLLWKFELILMFSRRMRLMF